MGLSMTRMYLRAPGRRARSADSRPRAPAAFGRRRAEEAAAGDTGDTAARERRLPGAPPAAGRARRTASARRAESSAARRRRAGKQRRPVAGASQAVSLVDWFQKYTPPPAASSTATHDVCRCGSRGRHFGDAFRLRAGRAPPPCLAERSNSIRPLSTVPCGGAADGSDRPAKRLAKLSKCPHGKEAAVANGSTTTSPASSVAGALDSSSAASWRRDNRRCAEEQ